MKITLKQLPFGAAIGLATALSAGPLTLAQSNAPQSKASTAPATAPAKTKTVSPSSNADTTANSHETVEYKDPEDMTTRYRPGNNKTTRTSAASSTSASPTAQAEAPAPTPDEKKHISNVKWEDRQVATPSALDAGSKDAAKAPTALDGASKDAAKSKTAPSANSSEKKRQNSVESISVQH